ncbi:MAG: menaquinone biosynthesis protein [Gemmatimonadaceae bacterium]
MLSVGRIPYINCYPVYGAIDRGLVPLDARLVDGVPTKLNRLMAEGQLDVSVVSAVEYARDASRYLVLPNLAISCDGPVQSVMLFSRVDISKLSGKRVLVSRSSMTSVALLELLFANVWNVRPEFVLGDAELVDIARFGEEPHDARLVIGDAALRLFDATAPGGTMHAMYPVRADLGQEWKSWTGLPFVFAVWVAQRTSPRAKVVAAHHALVQSRDWGLMNLDVLAEQASQASGVSVDMCSVYLSGLDYRLSPPHLAGLSEFFRKLVAAGRVPDGDFAFLPAA